MHPRNKKVRNDIGRKKGQKRANGLIRINNTMGLPIETQKDILQHHAKRHKDVTKQCNCSMCANPRELEGRHIQEKRFNESCNENY